MQQIARLRYSKAFSNDRPSRLCVGKRLYGHGWGCLESLVHHREEGLPGLGRHIHQNFILEDASVHQRPQLGDRRTEDGRQAVKGNSRFDGLACEPRSVCVVRREPEETTGAPVCSSHAMPGLRPFIHPSIPLIHCHALVRPSQPLCPFFPSNA